jgi:hypothetical protein
LVKVNYQYEKRKKELDKKRKKEQKLREKQYKKGNQPSVTSNESHVDSPVEKAEETAAVKIPVENPEK